MSARPSPKAKAVTIPRLKGSYSSGRSTGRSSRSTGGSSSDVMTQTESTPSPSDDTLTTSPSVQASSSRTGDGDDTPKRGRGILSDSWDLASLDPATWPVLKDPFGTSTFRFTMDRMSMASVPEGELSTTSQTLEDTVAEAQQQNEELHQLCWDVLRLAASLEKVKEAPLSHRDLVEETQRCMQLLRQRLQDVPRQVAAERPVGPVGPVSASRSGAGSPMAGPAPAPRSPILKQFRLVDPSIVSSVAAPSALPSAPCTPCTPCTITLHSPPQVSRFVSDGRASPEERRAFSPLRPVWPVVPGSPGSPPRSRSVSVTRRHYRQCWVLEREERFLF